MKDQMEKQPPFAHIYKGCQY